MKHVGKQGHAHCTIFAASRERWLTDDAEVALAEDRRSLASLSPHNRCRPATAGAG